MNSDKKDIDSYREKGLSYLRHGIEFYVNSADRKTKQNALQVQKKGLEFLFEYVKGSQLLFL